jgi:hypothetical protein
MACAYNPKHVVLENQGQPWHKDPQDPIKTEKDGYGGARLPFQLLLKAQMGGQSSCTW